MFRNLLLTSLIFFGTLYWLVPSFQYIQLVKSIETNVPRYAIELSLATSYCFCIGTLLLLRWFIPCFNQYSYPIGYALVFLSSCLVWDIGVQIHFFDTFHFTEPAPYCLSILLFHFSFSTFFAIYLWYNSESTRFNMECRTACFINGVASALVLTSGFSEVIVCLIYCFLTMISIWFGINGMLVATKRTFKSNQIGWILPLPGTLLLAYLILAPHIPGLVGARVLASSPDGFHTKLTILGKPITQREREQKKQLTLLHKHLQDDAKSDKYPAQILIFFLLFGVCLESQKKKTISEKSATDNEQSDTEPLPSHITPENLKEASKEDEIPPPLLENEPSSISISISIIEPSTESSAEVVKEQSLDATSITEDKEEPS